MARKKVIIPLKTQASILAPWKEILQYNLVSVIKGRVEEFWGESAAFNTPMAPNGPWSQHILASSLVLTQHVLGQLKYRKILLLVTVRILLFTS